jgi:hypothetical protein
MKLGVAGFALLMGCALPAAPDDEGVSAARESRAETTPLLSFNADWSNTASGPITSGEKATIHYDVSRMPTCRAWYRGYPAWDMVAYYAVDGGPARYVALTKLEGTTRLPVDVTIDVPIGRDLAIWFHASDAGGCSQWDSAYGQNFHYPLAAGAPGLRFLGDWSTRTVGDPAPGTDLLVDFDPIRLPGCRAMYNGYAAWDIVAHYRFDGGEEQSASVTKVIDGYQRLGSPARIAAPAGARHLELWFENHDRTGCRTWDSRYGANYHFDL